MGDDFQDVSLSVARLGVKIASPQVALIRGLRARYGDFSPAQQIHFTAEIELHGSASSSAFLDADPKFTGERVRFDTPDYQGEIDLEAGAGYLSLRSARPVEDVDYFLRVIYAFLVFRAGGILFHAAGIVRGEKGYLFFGYSGSGKTTVARLSPHDTILNDDLVVLMPEGGNWVVYATPFWNPTQVKPSASSAPVARLLRLVQDKKVYVEPMEKGQALAEVLASVPVVSTDPANTLALIQRCSNLIENVPVQRLHFLPDDSFWGVIHQGG